MLGLHIVVDNVVHAILEHGGGQAVICRACTARELLVRPALLPQISALSSAKLSCNQARRIWHDYATG